MDCNCSVTEKRGATGRGGVIEMWYGMVWVCGRRTSQLVYACVACSFEAFVLGVTTCWSSRGAEAFMSGMRDSWEGGFSS
jgi:hypothetical protein